MNPILIDILQHVGVSITDGAPGRGSGRYPLGSGKNPYQRPSDFLARVEKLKKDGLSEKQIADAMGITTTQLRAHKAIASSERRSALVATARQLREEGYSLKEIANKMGYSNDSSVRSLLNEGSEDRMNKAMKTAEFLKEQIARKGMIDVGSGVERSLGVTPGKLNEALEILKAEGYEVYGRSVAQVTNPGQQTHLKILCPPGTEHRETYELSDIHSIDEFTSRDGGVTFESFVYPKSMDSSRLSIRYAEEGGEAKDGVIELRRGVKDLDLGESHYAQVRILVDGDRYLKGMAVYSDDLPEGVDVRFNTNKKQGTPMRDVLKKTKDDPENPFGSLIKANGQSYYDDPEGDHIDPLTGKRQSLSLINKRAEEGDWGDWSDHLPSQFLSKQSMQLIDRQLKLSEADKAAEFDEICSLTNPTVKKILLQSFSEDCDSAAVHLQAAALPRQKYQVILPLTTIKDTEVYAPNYNNGEEVVLIRYPHGGTFEIPRLTVNNKVPEGIAMMSKTPKDAIGISKSVADRLSGADFDGDTVMVIPVGGKVKITSTQPLEGLKGFDPKDKYGYDSSSKDENGDTHYYRNGREFRVMRNTQNEMGKISNLITDMTLRGASEDELAAAVRHSMVVIDAEKHKLDYKQSEIDNGVKDLRRKYQDGPQGGASTLISRAKSPKDVDKRRGSPIIDPATGEVSYKLANETYVDKKGNTVVRKQRSTKMAEVKDARILSSGTPQEERYADYANFMKAMGNQARKEMLSTGKIPYSSSARQTYQKEFDHVMAELNEAAKNAPRERRAQMIANSEVAAKKKEHPDMTRAEIKKASQMALTSARNKVGAQRKSIVPSDREWEAMQSGAFSEHQLLEVFRYVDTDTLRQRAMPRATTTLSDAKVAKIHQMAASGYSTAEIAKSMSVSSSTITKYL